MKEEKGFTLIELMIVVVIVGIAAAIVIPLYSQRVERDRCQDTEKFVAIVHTRESRTTMPKDGQQTELAT